VADYRYPANDLDLAENLLAVVGSFWSLTYQGNDFLQSALFSVGQLAAQAHLDFLELIASISRFEIPVFHTENWRLLTIRESELLAGQVPVYSTSNPPANYSQNSSLQYGQRVPGSYSCSLPEGFHDCRVVLNRITDASLTLIRDIDFQLSPGLITFQQNPFANPLVLTREVWENGAVIDREAGLWLFRGQWDWDTVYQQFGYVLGLRLASSEGYKELVNAILDALVEGTKIRDLQLAWSAITGVPLVREQTETVEEVLADSGGEVVITDRQAYRFPAGSTVLVSPGDTLSAGDPLVDTLQFYEFNRGQVPDGLTGLALGPGFLSAGFWGDLVWENKTVALVVEENVDGYTKVSWEISGFPADVEKFWDDVRAQGRFAAGHDQPAGVPLPERAAASHLPGSHPFR
jgi:hypothetical protein